MSVVSARIRAVDAAFAAVKDFYLTSQYGKRRGDPGICDLTFGNPHEMPLEGLSRRCASELCQEIRIGLPIRQAKKSRKSFWPNGSGANLHCRSSHPTLR
jgi:hypothetical protein